MKLRLWHKEVNMTGEVKKAGLYYWNVPWKDRNTLDSKEILTLIKPKEPVILLAKWVYIGKAETCNLGQANCSES